MKHKTENIAGTAFKFAPLSNVDRARVLKQWRDEHRRLFVDAMMKAAVERIRQFDEDLAASANFDRLANDHGDGQIRILHASLSATYGETEANRLIALIDWPQALQANIVAEIMNMKVVDTGNPAADGTVAGGPNPLN